MEKVILFGAGKIGMQALELIGKQNVICFVDNNITHIGFTAPFGIPVWGFEDYKQIAQKYVTIISMGECASREVAVQLQKENITRFLFWDEILPSVSFSASEIITSSRGRYDVKRDDVLIESDLQDVADGIIKEHLLWRDSDSRVEFYLVDAFEISHFLPLYEALNERGIKSRFVVEPPWFNTAGEWFDYKQAELCLKRCGIEYSTLANSEVPIAFTTQFPRNLSHYRRIKCQMFYGVNFLRKKIFQFREEVIKGFDYVFVHGNFGRKKLSHFMPWTHTIDMSFPRYMSFFAQKPTSYGVKKELGICTDKPILLYYPTWDEYSSIQRFADYLGALRRDFFAVVKPHHCTWRLPEKRMDMEKLRQNFDLVLESDYDLGKTVMLADIAVCDAGSGVLSEIAFLNPDLKLAVMYANNEPNDFYIDLSEIAMPIFSEGQCLKAIPQLWKEDVRRENRRIIINDAYSPDIENGLARSVDAIVEMLEHEEI